MKKIFILFVVLILTGCSNKVDFVNEINVDVVVNVTELVELDNGTRQFDTIRQVELLETFEITQIELLETGWAEFPYESGFLDEKDWGKYIDIIQDIFSEVSETNSIGGGTGGRVGPKAKLIITLQSDNLILECKFYQDSNEELVMMIINYTNSEDINVTKEYRDDFSEYYTRLNDLVIK